MLKLAKSVPCHIAFLDIKMRGMSGLVLAKEIKDINPKANIIFVTGYSQYKSEALDLRASGYLLKPATAEDVRLEIDNLRNPIVEKLSNITVHTFGNFEIFADEKPIRFTRSKSKECLAYLIDRKGSAVTTAEISSILFEDKLNDKKLNNQTQKIISDMMKSLRDANADEIILKHRNSIAIDTSKVDCDYYRAINGEVAVFNSFFGEYMTNYSWAEFTLGALCEKQDKVRK